MTKFLVLAAGLFGIAQVSDACSPMPRPYMQVMRVQKVLESQTFSEAMSKVLGNVRETTIVQIFPGAPVEVHFSNHCVIKGSLQYDPPVSNGMCPRFKGVSVETVCP